jgi:hypothetical protein
LSIEKRRLSAEFPAGHDHATSNDQCALTNLVCRGSTCEVNEDRECVASNDAGVTGEDGKYNFRYRGPVSAGRVRLTVRYRNTDGQEGDLEETFDIQHSGLIDYRANNNGSATLDGDTRNHESNLWMTGRTVADINNIVARYRANYSNSMILNDASIVYGGLFDISGVWATPHSAHRSGTNVDLHIHARSTVIIDGVMYWDTATAERWTTLEDYVRTETGVVPHNEWNSGHDENGYRVFLKSDGTPTVGGSHIHSRH